MTFKKILSISIVLVSMLFFSSSAFAAPVTQAVDVTAVVQTATITLVKVKDIDFGTITKVDASPGTITIDASGGAATPAATGAGVSVTGGNSGEITISSNVTANVTITYPVTSNLDKVGASSPTSVQQIEVKDFSTNSTGTSMSITAGTPATLHLGGVITLKASQEPGNYSVSLNFAVDY